MATIQRPQVVCWYLAFREVERSLHLVLNPALSWRDFQYYFDEAKREGLHAVDQVLRELLAKNPATICSIDPKDVLPREPGLAEFLYRRLVGRWRQSISFTSTQLHYFHHALTLFFKILDQPSKPPAEQLIQFRKMFYYCGHTIEVRCLGCEKLAANKNFTWFGRLPTQNPQSTNKALPEVA